MIVRVGPGNLVGDSGGSARLIQGSGIASISQGWLPVWVDGVLLNPSIGVSRED